MQTSTSCALVSFALQSQCRWQMKAKALGLQLKVHLFFLTLVHLLRNKINLVLQIVHTLKQNYIFNESFICVCHMLMHEWHVHFHVWAPGCRRIFRKTFSLFQGTEKFLYHIPLSLCEYLSFSGAYVPEGLLTSCTWDYMTFTPSVRAYTMLLFIFVFFLPLFIIIYCYVFIFRAIRSTNRSV